MTKPADAAKPDPLREACRAFMGDAWNKLTKHGRDVAMVRMEHAIDAYEAAVTILRRCDEPGCEKEATSGTPSAAGYRRTCYEHRPGPKP